mmetsp:Transcript_114461/g.227812  ORF Transcript_114461/g.227812 Transcript_114461/m.227812 type:complete len:100 (-) Transcript_114461:1310-1609(-)
MSFLAQMTKIVTVGFHNQRMLSWESQQSMEEPYWMQMTFKIRHRRNMLCIKTIMKNVFFGQLQTAPLLENRRYGGSNNATNTFRGVKEVQDGVTAMETR